MSTLPITSAIVWWHQYESEWTMGGIDTVGPNPDLFNTFSYDIATGGLVHVNSYRIPSVTQCVAGESGTKLDVFQCESQLVECR